MLTCAGRGCTNTQSDLSVRLFGQKGSFMDDDWYCAEECLSAAMRTSIERKLAPMMGNEADLLQRPLIGLILLESALISREQLQEALTHQKREKASRLGQVLQRLGFVKEQDITAALARQSGFPRLNLDRIAVNEAILRMIPARISRLQRICPIEYDPDRNRLSIVMANPDRSVVMTLEKMLGLKILPYVGDETLLREVIEQYFSKESEEGNVEEATVGLASGLASIVQEILNRAKKLQSRDMWVERCGRHLWVRMTVGTEAYNLFLSFAARGRESELLDSPLTKP